MGNEFDELSALGGVSPFPLVLCKSAFAPTYFLWNIERSKRVFAFISFGGKIWLPQNSEAGCTLNSGKLRLELAGIFHTG